MSDQKTHVKHPAFGNIQLSRVSGHAKLHDSPLFHQHYIALRISTASMDRDLNSNWHHPEKEIVEVYLSEAQFAQAITSMNTTGTPCTLGHYRDPVTGETIRPHIHTDDIPSSRQLFDAEIKATVEKLATLVESAHSDLATVLSHKAVPVKVKEAALGVLGKIQYVTQNLPFIQTMFHEAMEKTESHAKTELVALANALVHSRGLEALGIKRTDLLGEAEVVEVEGEDNK